MTDYSIYKEYESLTREERLLYAVKILEQEIDLPFSVVSKSTIEIDCGRGRTVRFHPYKGWFSGKGVQDGRGIRNLIKQLKAFNHV